MVKADILQYYELLLRCVVRKTKYYIPPCDMVQVPEGAVTAVTVPTLQTSRVMAYLPYIWSQVHSLTSSKKAILEPHQQANEMAKASTKRNGGKREKGFLKFLPVPFHTAFSLFPSHIWTAQCIHNLIQWIHTPLVLVIFGVDFTSINKSLSISFECCSTSEKEARVQYTKVFFVIH